MDYSENNFKRLNTKVLGKSLLEAIKPFTYASNKNEHFSHIWAVYTTTKKEVRNFYFGNLSAGYAPGYY